MTIPNTTDRADYVGDGATLAFTFAFKIFSLSQLKVILTDLSGNSTTQALTTNYTVANTAWPTGGTVTFLTAPAAGFAVTIRRVLDGIQTTTFNNGGEFFEKAHEDAFDTRAMVNIQMLETLAKALQFPESEIPGTASAVLPTVANRAGKNAAFDLNGNLIATGVAPTGGVIAASYRVATVTNGGQATADTWTDYPLTSLDINDGTVASLSANAITLPAGSYEVEDAQAQINHFQNAYIRVIRTDTNAVLANSIGGFHGDLNVDSKPRIVPKRFVLASVTSVKMQYFVHGVETVGSSSSDLGLNLMNVTLNTEEIYGGLRLRKIA